MWVGRWRVGEQRAIGVLGGGATLDTARSDRPAASHLHGPDEHRVEQLVVLVTLRRADVDQLPLDVVLDRRDTLERDLKL